MPSYKLYYFDLPGRGEIIRLLLHYGGIKFEDIRLGQDQWQVIKNDTPFGQLPVLEIDGVKHFQSIAIARYVANEVKLTGSNNLENMQIDVMVDTLSDFLQLAVNYALVEKDPSRKRELFKQIIDNTAPFVLGKLDSIARTNGGHLALGRLTWADLFMVVVYENTILWLQHDVWTKYPNLLRIKNKVLAIPNIRNYIKNRPSNGMGNVFDLKQHL